MGLEIIMLNWAVASKDIFHTLEWLYVALFEGLLTNRSALVSCVVVFRLLEMMTVQPAGDEIEIVFLKK